MMFTSNTTANDDETEREAIELIRSQVSQIKFLQDEIARKDDFIEGMKLQVNQVEMYKDQTNNLKKQIQICEEKLKLYDADSLEKSYQVEDRMRLQDQIEREMNEEIQEKDKLILVQQKEIEEKIERIELLQKEICDKELQQRQMCDQVGQLKNDFCEIDQQFKVKEESYQQQISRLEKKQKGETKGKSKVESKVKELEGIINQYQCEVEELTNVIATKEKEISRGKRECARSKLELDKAFKEKEQLFEDAHFVPQMREKIDDFTSAVERIQKELDAERKKTTRLLKDNEKLRKDLSEYNEKCHGENSPEVLKQKMAELRTRITSLNNQLKSKSKESSNLESRCHSMEGILKESFTSLKLNMKTLQTFIDNVISNPTVLLSKETDQIRLSEAFPISLLEILGNLNLNSCDPNKLFSDMTKSLKKCQKILSEKLRQTGKKYEGLKQEYMETNQIRSEITGDFNRLKSALIEQEQKLNSLSQVNQELKQLQSQDRDEFMDLESKYDQLKNSTRTELEEILKSLQSYKSKYQNDPIVNEQINFQSYSLTRPIEQRSLNGQVERDMLSQVKEYFQMISDVTNTLNFHIKAQQIQLSETAEVKRQLHNLQIESQQNYEKMEDDKKVEINNVSERFQKHISDLKQEICSLEQELEKGGQKYESKVMEVQVKEKEMLEMGDKMERMKVSMKKESHLVEILKRCYVSLVQRVDELIDQKKILKKEYNILSENYHQSQKRIQLLNQRYSVQEEFENLLSADVSKQEDYREVIHNEMDEVDEQYENDEVSFQQPNNRTHLNQDLLIDDHGNPSPILQNHYEPSHLTLHQQDQYSNHYSKCLKFRKYVIAIIAYNRFRKMITPTYIQYGKTFKKLGNLTDFYTSNDQNLLKELQKKLQFISIPPPPSKSNAEQDKDGQKQAYDTIHNTTVYQTYKPNIEDCQMIMQIVAEGVTQNLYGGQSQKPYRLQGPMSSMLNQFDSVNQMLSCGLTQIKTSISSQPPESFSNLNYDMQYLYFVFCTKSFLQRHMTSLEISVDRQTKNQVHLEYMLKEVENEANQMRQKVGYLEDQNIEIYSKNEELCKIVNCQNDERVRLVEKEKFEELLGEHRELKEELIEGRSQVEELENKVVILKMESESLLSERNKLGEEVSRLENKVCFMKRDLELKQIQVDSLENMMKRRDSEIENLHNNQKGTLESKENLRDLVQRLETEKENLIKDNLKLIHQNDQHRKSIQHLPITNQLPNQTFYPTASFTHNQNTIPDTLEHHSKINHDQSRITDYAQHSMNQIMINMASAVHNSSQDKENNSINLGTQSSSIIHHNTLAQESIDDFNSNKYSRPPLNGAPFNSETINIVNQSNASMSLESERIPGKIIRK